MGSRVYFKYIRPLKLDKYQNPNLLSDEDQSLTFMSNQSESKAAELRLVALEEELAARVLAEDMMIHDVRNPISSIISIADMLSAGTANEDDKLWLTRILTLGYRALDILKATAGYAQMERDEHDTGGESLRPAPVLSGRTGQAEQIGRKSVDNGCVLS